MKLEAIKNLRKVEIDREKELFIEKLEIEQRIYEGQEPGNLNVFIELGNHTSVIRKLSANRDEILRLSHLLNKKTKREQFLKNLKYWK